MDRPSNRVESQSQAYLACLNQPTCVDDLVAVCTEHNTLTCHSSIPQQQLHVPLEGADLVMTAEWHAEQKMTEQVKLQRLDNASIRASFVDSVRTAKAHAVQVSRIGSGTPSSANSMLTSSPLWRHALQHVAHHGDTALDVLLAGAGQVLPTGSVTSSE